MPNVTNKRPQQIRTPTGTHEHGWNIESRHLTSVGYILYVRCNACGTRRVDLQEDVGLPPSPLSNAIGSHPVRVSDA